VCFLCCSVVVVGVVGVLLTCCWCVVDMLWLLACRWRVVSAVVEVLY